MIHLGAHDVAVSRLFAVSRVSGVVGIIWAIGVGVFILAGGAKHLTAPAYLPLITIAGSYRMVGAGILIGGLIGIIGLAADWRSLSVASCVLCTLWCGMVAGFLLVGNFGTNGNLVSLFALHSAAIYILRFWLLVIEPNPREAVKLR